MKKINRIQQFALVLLAVSPLLRADSSIRVNAGGPQYTDSAGNVWAADNGFTSGGTFGTGAAIANTNDPTLYQTERYGTTGTLEYTTPVANGQYNVTLKFAEIYFTGAGERVFNIVINGTAVQNNFDPWAAAGGTNIAVDRTYPITVTNGTMDIQLVPVIQNPKISALEIDPAPASNGSGNTSTGPSFADQEIPSGAINGANNVFSLAHAPTPAGSLILVRNGLVMQQGSDYSLTGSSVTFASGSVPQTGDSLLAFYRY